MPNFNPETDIPDLSGKVCLVTGGNAGLGEATLAALAQHNPGKLYLAARSRARAEAAVERIRATSPAAAAADIEIVDMDLASLKSVAEAAAKIDSETSRLDLLQLNGGIAMVPHATTADGYEVQFGTNYLGHALLTQLLMPKLLATAKLPGADVRIVSMSSIGHRKFELDSGDGDGDGGGGGGGILFGEVRTDMRRHTAQQLYGQAMLAKVLLARELARRYGARQITATSLHPGTVKTGVWGGATGATGFVWNCLVPAMVALTGVSNAEGAKTQLWLGFADRTDVENGRYYEPVGQLGAEGRYTSDDGLAQRLWEWTEAELAARGAPGWPAVAGP